jgi:uncharacterized protein YhaN
MAWSIVTPEHFRHQRERIAQRRVERESKFAADKADLKEAFEKQVRELDEQFALEMRELDELQARIIAAEQTIESFENGGAALVERPIPQTQKEIVLEAVQRLNPGLGVVRSGIRKFAKERYGVPISEENITAYLGQLKQNKLVVFNGSTWIPIGGWKAD